MKNQNNLLGKSKLKYLKLYLGSEGITRAYGHLDYSSLTCEKKHPVVLPNNNKISKIIFEYFYKKFFI